MFEMIMVAILSFGMGLIVGATIMTQVFVADIASRKKKTAGESKD